MNVSPKQWVLRGVPRMQAEPIAQSYPEFPPCLCGEADPAEDTTQCPHLRDRHCTDHRRGRMFSHFPNRMMQGGSGHDGCLERGGDEHGR